MKTRAKRKIKAKKGVGITCVGKASEVVILGNIILDRVGHI